MILVADSCSDIKSEDLKKRNIEVVRLSITIDDVEYTDQIDITSEEVLQKITEGHRPLTSQVNPDEFESLFRELLERDNEILYIAFSSGLSGTYQSSVIARDVVLEDFPDAKIEILDSLSASYGLGYTVERASDLVNAGESFDNVVTETKEMLTTIRHLFTVSDLDYLAKGGRLSKGSAFLGGLLNIRPLLHVEEGKLVPIEKHRGEKKVLKSMINKVKDEGASGKAYIAHANALDTAEKLKELLLAETKIDEVKIKLIGPTIASHTGNGTVALFYYKQ
ncbi:DegV family protein [Aliicoccus persicus]|uniref:EDD domain protein, DegV family n=1 Tax=Aliicoccus persicus TaxID=930138 RepID=A0A662Z5T2_9STAP|nr:DegV family protein [Aliicoccus persicus]SEW02339.1 EDD domain protein, DegV family [Aliicoccus persicus]